MNTLVFDIETVPDVELGRRLYGLHDLDDAGVAKAMFAKQRQLRQNDFLPPPQQRVVAISVRAAQPRRALRSSVSATSSRPSASSCSGSSTVSSALRRCSCPGTARASICPC